MCVPIDNASPSAKLETTEGWFCVLGDDLLNDALKKQMDSKTTQQMPASMQLACQVSGDSFCIHPSKSKILRENIRKQFKWEVNGKVFSDQKSID